MTVHDAGQQQPHTQKAIVLVAKFGIFPNEGE